MHADLFAKVIFVLNVTFKNRFLTYLPSADFQTVFLHRTRDGPGKLTNWCQHPTDPLTHFFILFLFFPFLLRTICLQFLLKKTFRHFFQKIKIPENQFLVLLTPAENESGIKNCYDVNF